MGRCALFGLDCVGGEASRADATGDSTDAPDDRDGRWCPVCRLKRSPPDETVSEERYRRARLALGFETASTVRSRLLDAVNSASTTDSEATTSVDSTATSHAGDGESPLRVNHLRRLGEVLGLSAEMADGLTARELRRYVIDRVGVDASPASTFRKDTLVEVTVHVVDVVDPSRDPHGEHGCRDEADLSH